MLSRVGSSSSTSLAYNVLVVDIESQSLPIILKLALDEMVLMVEGDLLINSRMMMSLSLGAVVDGRGRAGFSSSFSENDSCVADWESSDRELRADL